MGERKGGDGKNGGCGRVKGECGQKKYTETFIGLYSSARICVCAFVCVCVYLCVQLRVCSAVCFSTKSSSSCVNGETESVLSRLSPTLPTGLEQTRGAAPLETFTFPRRTALVLGREREGIDADVLGMLDGCVVIAQKGLIRSLNVHVSASLAIHRYSAQATAGFPVAAASTIAR